ncbi:MAG: hypothetical protein WC460_03955 [Patescibacteria group bacterium]
MSDRTKKILLVILFVVVTLLLALAIYYLFFRPIISPPTITGPIVTPPSTIGLPTIPPALNLNIPPTVSIPPGLRPEIPSLPLTPSGPSTPAIAYQANGGITSFQTLINTPAKSPALATNGKDLIYYDSTTGYFYDLTPDGQKQFFSDQIFKNVSNAIFAPNKQKAILEYPDGSKLIYDFNQNKSVTLPSHWKDFVFSPDSTKIAFKDMRVDPENRFLAIADSNGGNYKEIERLGEEDEYVYTTWSPNNSYVALARSPLDGDRSEVLPIGLNGENYASLIVEGRDLRFAWTPSGNKLVYSVFNSQSNYNPELWVVNSSPDILGTGRNNLDLQTWADKCVFSSENIIYCGVPRTLEMGSGFSPDMANSTPDDIYKIDISTGAKQLLAQPLFPTTIDKMIVSTDGKTLYWLEKNTGQIKKMDL